MNLGTVYTIRCKSNDKRYIGATFASLPKRYGNHKNLLKQRHHYNCFLQEDWEIFGAANFISEVLEQGHCTKAVLTEVERFYISQTPQHLLYNIQRNPDMNDSSTIQSLVNLQNAIGNLVTDLSAASVKAKLPDDSEAEALKALQKYCKGMAELDDNFVLHRSRLEHYVHNNTDVSGNAWFAKVRDKLVADGYLEKVGKPQAQRFRCAAKAS